MLRSAEEKPPAPLFCAHSLGRVSLGRARQTLLRPVGSVIEQIGGGEMKQVRIMRLSCILMSLGLAVVAPFGLGLVATWREPWIEVSERHYIQNFQMPMGFAFLTLICVGIVVTWTGFRDGARSAWLILFLIAWLFYFPVLIYPQIRGHQLFNLGARIALLGESAAVREKTLHLFGFVLMLVALVLPLRRLFTDRTGGRPWRSAEQ